MESLSNLFLHYISEQTFLVKGSVQECIFKLRFNPEYYSYPHNSSNNSFERKRQKSIADLVEEEIGGVCSGINQQIAEVIKKIYERYHKEMNQDGIDDRQLKGKQGRKNHDEDSPWQVVYDWLWNKKYCRWLLEYIWENWKAKAEINREWIQFLDTSEESSIRGMVIPKAAPKPKVPINIPLNMEIHLQHSGHYLLLFNCGEDNQGHKTKYLIMPSHAFAPSYRLEADNITMPQNDAMSQDIQFNAIGKEEYLGIIIDQALELNWLTPDPENPVIKLNGKHLEAVWEKLQKQENWQVYYREFEVVSSCN